MDDDGLTPLLPHSGRHQLQQQHQEIKLPSKKLAAFGLSIALFTLIDIGVCSYCSTGGFSGDWRARLGLGDGAYPFGSAGLDILVLGVLRYLVAAVGCFAFFLVLHQRSNLRLVGDPDDDPSCSGDYNTEGTATPAASPPASRAWRDQDGKQLANGAGPVGGRNELESGSARRGTTSNSSGSSSTSFHMSAWAKWLQAVCPSACGLTIAVIVAKCLTRLVAGPGSGSGCGLRTAWFWASIGWSAAAAGVEFFLATGFTNTCRRYCFLRYCRKWGDFESALGYRDGYAGAGEGGGKGDGYSATFGDILALCREDLSLIMLAFVALLLAATSQVLIPHFTGNMIDNVVEGGEEDDFRRSTVYLVLAAVACAIFSGTRGGIFTIVGARVNVRVRRRLFESLVRQEIGFFDTTKTGDLTSRLASDCTKIGDQVTLNVNVFLRNFVMVVVTLLFMFYLSWRLSLVAFISVPAIVTVSKWYGQYIRNLSKLSQDKLAEAGSVAEESLSSMSTVRSFAAEGRESKEYANKLQDYYVLSKKSGYAYGLYASSYVLLPNLVTAIVLFYGGQLVMEGQITGGKVVSFMIYLTSLSDGFNDMASIFSSMTQAVGAADKVFELIKREPKGATQSPPPRTPETGMLSSRDATAAAAAAASGVTPEVCLGEVELRGIDFEYPSRPGRRILDGVSFKAAAGQVVALVGPSGGGKSSCIALLENLYQPSRGQVMLDGIPVHKFDHHWLHRSISIVGQEPTLYARSIRENITYGLEGEEPSLVEVEEAARLANAHTFISQLPEKYSTQAGERGVQMSGGQKQRIAIARALVRKPKVLLLDEATSALDAESEHLVQQAIDNMIARGGMTVILIAHRLSTVKRADKIVVIRGGKVAEEGTHEELLATDGGVYAGLVKRQLDVSDSSSSSSSSSNSSSGNASASGKVVGGVKTK